MTKRPVTVSERRKARDIAAVLPMAMVFLILPPMAYASVGAGELFGIPATVIYMFGVWLGVIVLTAWNNRRLGATDVVETDRIDATDYPP